MPNDILAARKYLAPPAGSLWEWREAGSVMTWLDGTTIAFLPECEEVLRRLEPHGFPPMGAVVLLLAACRETWNSVKHSVVEGVPVQSDRLDVLDAIHALSRDLDGSLESKVLLAEMAFETCDDRSTPDEASAILRILQQGLPAEMFAPRTRTPRSSADKVRELACIGRGLASLDVAAFGLRQRTGLDQLIEPAEPELLPADKALRMIAQLANDWELKGLARLARDLLAAVHLPRSLADHEELPLGGVSDISNRGPLDRLLLSELANDDLTLMVRLALNEALFLRREAPPRNPPRGRAVLIDSGIRMWGVPRVFATAVALSLTATSDREAQVLGYRACGKRIEPIDLTTREGLIAHLEALELDPHPGAALPSFMEQVTSGEGVADVVLVTGADVFRDAGFQKALADLDLPVLYIATVSRTGEFQLFCKTARGMKVIGGAAFTLDELLTPPRCPVTSLIDTSRAQTMPAILSITPFPLLLSHPVDGEQDWVVKDYGVLSMTKDRRLTHWSKPGSGARQLCDTLPIGKLQYCERLPRGEECHAVIGQLKKNGLYLLRIRIHDGDCSMTPLELDGDSPRAVTGAGGVVFVIFADHVEAFSAIHGLRNGSLALPTGWKWIRDCFLQGPDGLYVMVFDGAVIRREHIVNHKQLSGWMLSALFRGDAGPLGLTSLGQIINMETGGVLMQISAPLRLLGVSRDDASFACETGGKRMLVDLKALTMRQIPHSPVHLLLEPEIASGPQPRQLRNAFIGVCADGVHLSLVSRKQHLWRLTLDRTHSHMRLIRQLGKADLGKCLKFEPGSKPDKRGFTLASAVWSDGSRAVLDSRGMLHLRSTDASLPEMSIVLYENELAGWCSNGQTWGPTYFTRVSTTSTVDVFDNVLQPFVARLPC